MIKLNDEDILAFDHEFKKCMYNILTTPSPVSASVNTLRLNLNGLGGVNMIDAEFEAEKLKIDFACALDDVMTYKGKTREDLASFLDMPMGFIEDLLRGDTNQSIEMMSKIASWLGMELQIKFIENYKD